MKELIEVKKRESYRAVAMFRKLIPSSHPIVYLDLYVKLGNEKKGLLFEGVCTVGFIQKANLGNYEVQIEALKSVLKHEVFFSSYYMMHYDVLEKQLFFMVKDKTVLLEKPNLC